MIGVSEDSVDAFCVKGGERGFPEFFQFDGSVGGDVGFEEFEKTDLVGVEGGILLNEGLEVLIHLDGVHANDAADGKSEALGFVRVMFERHFD